MLYFAWVKPEEVFHPELHARHDEKIFQLTLKEKEGEPAILSVVIQNPCKEGTFLPHQWAILSYRAEEKAPLQCLFRGVLCAKAELEKEHFLRIMFTSRIRPLEEDWETLAPEVEKLYGYDPLFDVESKTKDKKVASISAILAVTPRTLHWDRTRGTLSLSHALWGKRVLDLTLSMDAKRLSFAFQPIISKVTVEVNAQWIQQIDGMMDIAPVIAQQFPEGVINTYTGKTLSQHWPKPGHTLGSSGYYVAYSQLTSIDPPYYARFKAHPRGMTLKPLQSPKAQRNALQSLFIERSWFQSTLILAWIFRQKRQEMLTFFLEAALPNLCVPLQEETLSLNLQKIVECDELPFWAPFSIYEKGSKVQYKGWVYEAKEAHISTFPFIAAAWTMLSEPSEGLSLGTQDSFFMTPRGIKALEQAINRAKTHLSWGARCLRVQIAGPLSHFSEVTTQDSVLLKDPRLPEGVIEGKVVLYTLIAEGDSGKAEVQLEIACPISQEKPAPIVLPNPVALYAKNYASIAYVRHDGVAQHHGGIHYMRYDDQIPAISHKDLMHATFKNIVSNIHIENTPDKQEKDLLALEKEGISLKRLRGKGTRITLQFSPLRGSESLHHTINVRILNRWTPHMDKDSHEKN